MNSLKTRFIFVVCILCAGVILLLWNDAKTIKEIEKQNNLLFSIKDTQIVLLQMRRAEKDFFARQDLKYSKRLLLLGKKHADSFSFIGLDEDLRNYLLTFSLITADMRALGLSNEEGLKAKFIFHTQRLEQDLTEDKHTNILLKFLLMRKYEKDFFLHKQNKYLKLRREMIADIKADSRLKTHTAIFLDNYNHAFINLKTLMQTIGLNEKQGLRYSMRNSAHKIEDSLQKYMQDSIPFITKKVQKLHLIRYATFFSFLIIIFVLLFFWIKPIYKALEYFKSFFNLFHDSKQRIDLNTLKYDELKSMANVINSMLENRQVVEDNLIESKNEALHLQKVKDEFLTNMSHELRTPLNAIIGFSSLLQKKLPDEEKLIMPISTSSKHLLQLINDILDISKIQSGTFAINIDTFNLKEELDSCLEEFNFIGEEKNIKLIQDYSTCEQIALKGDWLRISQVVNNFLSNAFKFTPNNGTIVLKATYINEHLFISVKDSGIGIPKEAQERILNPFEQADSSTTKNFGGTGLGLSISQSIVTMMGGSIHIDSDEGLGSEFSFTLALEKDETLKDNSCNALQSTEEEISISAHVLVVEDNKTNQMLLTMLLDDVGITFDVANDGLEAVEMYVDNRYDIVLMDENMPRLNGVESMLQIRKEHTNVCPIIAVTANVMKGDEKRLLDAGMDGFVPKPIDDDELFATIIKFLKPSQA